MFLRQLSLYHFKNYIQHSFEFGKPIICLVGPNGSGKTTVLDAIHFLCFTKSYFLHSDALSIHRDYHSMRIDGVFEKNNDRYKLECILRENGKKELKSNDVSYTKFSAHIGEFPCVMICPDDVQLITEGSEVRRKFMDIICCMIYTDYLKQLNQYNKILQQRNSVLKQLGESGSTDVSLIQVYNQQMIPLANYIFDCRSAIAQQLSNYTHDIYATLSEQQDLIQLTYQSSLFSEPLADSLTRNMDKDLRSQRSNYGIHKDDLIFTLNSMPLKQAASQGQRKSFIFGIKLAMYKIMEENMSVKPLLLLDDIFEKLDQQRANRLIEFIYHLHTQIFVTDTHQQRLEQSFSAYRQEVEFIHI